MLGVEAVDSILHGGNYQSFSLFSLLALSPLYLAAAAMVGKNRVNHMEHLAVELTLNNPDFVNTRSNGKSPNIASFCPVCLASTGVANGMCVEHGKGERRLNGGARTFEAREFN